MDKEQTVSDMANEVLTRQAEARTERTGEPLEEALEAVLKTEAGRALRDLRHGAHRAERADECRKVSPGNGLRSDPRRSVDVRPLEAWHPTFFWAQGRSTNAPWRVGEKLGTAPPQ